jgi:hypothetical protein
VPSFFVSLAGLSHSLVEYVGSSSKMQRDRTTSASVSCDPWAYAISIGLRRAMPFCETSHILRRHVSKFLAQPTPKSTRSGLYSSKPTSSSNSASIRLRVKHLVLVSLMLSLGNSDTPRWSFSFSGTTYWNGDVAGLIRY